VIAFSQNKGLMFKSTGSLQYESNIKSFVAGEMPIDLVNNSYYRIIQFATTPTVEDQAILRSSGIQILEYIPDNAYLVAVSTTFKKDLLLSTAAEVVKPMTPSAKIEYRLTDWNIPSHAQVANKAKVAVVAMKGLSIKNFQFNLMALGLNVEYYGGDTRFAYLTLSEFEVQNVAQLPWVRYVEIIDEEGMPESTEGRTVQKSNFINNDLTGGLSYNADSVGVLVRDDGLVGPHIDFHGRLHNLTTDATGTHGDGVAGVMSAAGNLDPSVEAGGSGAEVFVINYLSTFQDNTLSLHQDSAVVITNSSYSNGCNAGYTTTTETVDNQVFNNQTLMHVFSAGNSNNSDCGYGAGNQWGNITGGHKVGKNVITTANLYNDASIVGSSSRGPAHDGRIKPDISGHGQGQMSTDPNNAYSPFGGTSAAAPSMAGNLAQLYEVYRSMHSGADPKSALIKAVALNSATDLGTKGPDFTFGWGLINTGRAYEIIANNQYKFATIGQGQSNSDSIVVPPGVGQLRIMVYWHDPAGAVNTTKALVNDLDLTVNGNLLPYVLDHTPNPNTLGNPATTGIDRLNNVEQVSIDNPTAGTYTIDIDGFAVPQGPQEYVLVYSFIKDEIKVTYPLGGGSLIPGRTEIIHWDAFGDNSSFTVQSSFDNGATWSFIANVTGNARLTEWVVPNIPTGQALVRVTRGAQSDVSDEIFNVFPVPTGLKVDSITINTAVITWDTVAGATSYDVYQLGSKFMENIASTPTNSYSLSATNGVEYWLAVAANGPGIEGERSNAVKIIVNPNSACGGCLAFSAAFPSAYGFESGMGNYCNEIGDDLDWLVYDGATPSTGTGPSGGSGSTNYIYLEASGDNFPSKSGILGGSCHDLSGQITASLSFDYHMHGIAMGSLELEVSTDGGSAWTSIWSKSGAQGNLWFNDTLDISGYTGGTFTFRFTGITGNDYTSDIALDNIVLSAYNCGFVPNITGVDPTVGNNGSATVNPIGAGAPFSYLWSTGNMTATSSNLPPGTYTVSVTDANSCTTTASTTLIWAGAGCFCSPISVFPHTEDFEQDEGSICQSSLDDFDWEINSGTTASTATGPSSAYQGNNYFYTESSNSNFPTMVAAFQSNCFDLTTYNQAEIDFWYHMYGAAMGALELDVSADDGATWTTVWSLTGDQTDVWKNAIIDVSSFAGTSGFVYRFTGTTGSSYTSDFALDQIVLDASFMTNSIDLETKVQLKVLPNPFNQYLEVRIDYPGSGSQNGQLEIIDVLGAVLIRQDIEWNNHFEVKLPMNIYSNGIYYLRYTDENNSLTRKVMKLE